MSENADQTADESQTATVPNISDGARSGFGDEQLERREPSTLAGSYDKGDVDPPDPYAKTDEDDAPDGEVTETDDAPDSTIADGVITHDGDDAVGDPGSGGPGDQVTGDGTGEALPPIEQEGGTPLDPPQPGADADGFGGDAPEPAGGSGDLGPGMDSAGAGEESPAPDEQPDPRNDHT